MHLLYSCFFFFYQLRKKGRRVQNEEEQSNEIGKTTLENIDENVAREKRR